MANLPGAAPAAAPLRDDVGKRASKQQRVTEDDAPMQQVMQQAAKEAANSSHFSQNGLQKPTRSVALHVEAVGTNKV